MKTKYLFMAAIGALTLVSCADESFVGDQEALNAAAQADGAIKFVSNTPAMTRAAKEGAEAAAELNNAFVVGGFKGASSVATTVVFDNYNVAYTANTANTTTSNTKNWEYVNLDVNSLASIYHAGDKQTIKYWDYSQAQYDFIAYSLGTGGATVTRITPATATSSTDGAYTLTGTTNQLKTVHIADLETVLNASYNQPVTLKFRKLASKVRMALYETVPGYSVKDVKFYTSDAAIDGGSSSKVAALYASSSVLPTEGTYTVYFPTVNSSTPTSDKNKAHVAFTTSTATQTNQTFGTLDNFEDAQKYEYTDIDDDDVADDVYLGRASNDATFAGTDPYYVDVLPLETGTALTLKVDYTLQSIDGTQETIKVVGAKAVVPAIYAQWKPGYAYTYIFKISDNTNGYTSGVESSKLSGLHAITFDAVEIQTEENNQETVTTVATPSITTYQNDPAVNVSVDDEYTAGTIYAMVMDGGSLKTDLNGVADPAKDAAKLYSLNRSATEAEVMEALNMQSKVVGTTIYGRNGLILTVATIDNAIHDEGIPGADGNKIDVADGAASKLTVASGTTYAYVYTVTQKSGADTDKYEVVPVTVGVTEIPDDYYTYDGVSTYTAVTVSDKDGSGKAKTGVTYYAKYTVNNGVYAVKVIKVKS